MESKLNGSLFWCRFPIVSEGQVASTAKTDSAELVKRIIAGDRFAEEELIRAYGRGVYYVLRRESRAQDVVDDLYQETFRIAIEKIRKGDLRDPSKAGAFLSSMARFVVIDHFRKESRHEASDIDEMDVALPEKSQLHTLIKQEHASLVRQTIGELRNERDRAILFRFFIAQEDKGVICRDLDLSALHFNRVLHRAKQRYKALFLEALNRS